MRVPLPPASERDLLILLIAEPAPRSRPAGGVLTHRQGSPDGSFRCRSESLWLRRLDPHAIEHRSAPGRAEEAPARRTMQLSTPTTDVVSARVLPTAPAASARQGSMHDPVAAERPKSTRSPLPRHAEDRRRHLPARPRHGSLVTAFLQGVTGDDSGGPRRTPSIQDGRATMSPAENGLSSSAASPARPVTLNNAAQDLPGASVVRVGRRAAPRDSIT